MVHLNGLQLMPIENITNQCQVDAEVDMAGLVKDVFAIVDQVVEQAHNTQMDEPKVVIIYFILTIVSFWHLSHFNM
jgi:hypothetical protein